MASGVHVWIGICFDLDRIADDDYADTATVSPTQEICQRRIDGRKRQGLTQHTYTPQLKLLIIKGRMTDR